MSTSPIKKEGKSLAPVKVKSQTSVTGKGGAASKSTHAGGESTHEWASKLKDPSATTTGYNGDLWGTKGEYSEGIVYLSRFSKPASFAPTSNNEAQVSTNIAKNIQESLDTTTVVPDSDKMRAKKRCAAALSSLSWDNGFENQIVNEGGLEALTALAVLKDKGAQMVGLLT
jgi:hypothetical protein